MKVLCSLSIVQAYREADRTQSASDIEDPEITGVRVIERNSAAPNKKGVEQVGASSTEYNPVSLLRSPSTPPPPLLQAEIQ